MPIEWRRLYVLAFYLYLRPGELRALTLGDVDLAADVVHVTKAYDEDSGELDTPKTVNGVRDVPIEPELRPLLVLLKERGRDPDLAAPLLAEYSEKYRAKMLRGHLKMAGVMRQRLYTSGPTTVEIDFRSCRDSGITWLALAGIEVARIHRRAGHDDVKTTLGYVKMAEDIKGTVGVPFGPLPPALLEGLGQGLGQAAPVAKPFAKVAPAAGLEPEASVLLARTRVDSGQLERARVDASARFADDGGPIVRPPLLDVDDALARALSLAAEAGRWDVVALLARELEARRVGAARKVIRPGDRRRTGCGASRESCCTSLEVEGGTFYRTYANDGCASGTPVGAVGAFFRDGWPDIELGWNTFRAYWGQGIPTEAATEVIRYAFDAPQREPGHLFTPCDRTGCARRRSQ